MCICPTIYLGENLIEEEHIQSKHSGIGSLASYFIACFDSPIIITVMHVRHGHTHTSTGKTLALAAVHSIRGQGGRS